MIFPIILLPQKHEDKILSEEAIIYINLDSVVTVSHLLHEYMNKKTVYLNKYIMSVYSNLVCCKTKSETQNA